MDHKKISFLIAIASLLYHMAIAIDFAQLKDTYAILSDDYTYCSPIHGAVWVEAGLLKKYSKYYAQATPATDLDAENAQHFTVKLLQKIFLLIGESLSVTRNIGKPEHYLSPRIIGSIIGIIEESTLKDKALLSGKIETFIKQDNQFLSEIASTTKKPLSDDKAMSVRIKRFANAIVGSLDECGFWTGKSSLYPRYMTHAILLGCLYKISNSKADLREYFNALTTKSSKNIFTSIGKNIFDQPTWNTTSFDQNTLNAVITTCSQQANFAPSQNTLPQLLQIITNSYQGLDPFEALVCAEISKQFYSKSLPLVIGQNKAQPTFQGRPYSDCTEVALRNLCNFIVFDQEKLMFIPLKTEHLDPCPAIIQYYQADRADANKHTRSDMYQTWGNVLQNIPGFIYTATEFDGRLLGNDLFNQHKAHPCYVLLNPADIQRLGLPKSSRGDFYDLVINGEDYRAVDATKHKAYGVWQSLKNIIIVMNYLFGLKLYDDPLTPFKDATFCSKYFPELCKKFGWAFTNPKYELVFHNPPPHLAFPNPFTFNAPYIYWCHTIHINLAQDPRISWDCHIKWHHIEIRNVRTLTPPQLSTMYKQTLYDGLLMSGDSMQTYALMALYAPKTDAEKDKTINNLLSNDTVKNRFALYLQNLDALTAEVPPNTLGLNALKVAQSDSGKPKVKKPVDQEKKTERDLQVRLKVLKGKLIQLKNKLSLLKKNIGLVAQAFETKTSP